MFAFLVMVGRSVTSFIVCHCITPSLPPFPQMEALALAQAAGVSGSSSVGSGGVGEEAFLHDHLTRHRSYNAGAGGVVRGSCVWVDGLIH